MKCFSHHKIGVRIIFLFTDRITFLQSELSTYKYGAYMPVAEFH